MELEYNNLNVLVGFEIHQQLSTSTKLFCNCKCGDSLLYNYSFTRKLRPTRSELGTIDTAALFEFGRSKRIKYNLDSNHACLVEADEEPPHKVNSDALYTSLLVAKALESNIVDEIQIMRKIVIDGSNTCGFQRTMLISTGGFLDASGKKIKIENISLEEDAAKPIANNEELKEYGLDRLGIPLLEVSLEPISGTPEDIVNVALTLGRLLRMTKRVARGIGSIRQDVNISIKGGNVVEVKGVQQIDQLLKVIQYEVKRQAGLLVISDRIIKNKKRAILDAVDITVLLEKSTSKIIRGILEKKGNILAIPLKCYAGILGFEPFKDVRLGKEIGGLAKFFGLGGIFHSDELPNYGIDSVMLSEIRNFLQLEEEDAFIMIGGEKEKIGSIVEAITKRLKDAEFGTPSETRIATRDGITVFARPKPGSARMYPETDVSPILITSELLTSLEDYKPISYENMIIEIVNKYNIPKQLAEQIFDSDYFEIFESLANSLSLSPAFIASKLTEDITNFQRQGYNKNGITKEMIREIFTRLHKGILTKESIPMIFENILSGKANSIDDAIKRIGLSVITDHEANQIIDRIIDDNIAIIHKKGTSSIGLLMGRCMSKLRGKYDGQKINQMLNSKIEKIIKDET